MKKLALDNDSQPRNLSIPSYGHLGKNPLNHMQSKYNEISMHTFGEIKS